MPRDFLKSTLGKEYGPEFIQKVRDDKILTWSQRVPHVNESITVMHPGSRVHHAPGIVRANFSKDGGLEFRYRAVDAVFRGIWTHHQPEPYPVTRPFAGFDIGDQLPFMDMKLLDAHKNEVSHNMPQEAVETFVFYAFTHLLSGGITAHIKNKPTFSQVNGGKV